jgi:hypothetical protein
MAEPHTRRLNMESDLQRFIWGPVQVYSLDETPSPRISAHIRYEGAMVSQDRRHLFVTPCPYRSPPPTYLPPLPINKLVGILKTHNGNVVHSETPL